MVVQYVFSHNVLDYFADHHSAVYYLFNAALVVFSHSLIQRALTHSQQQPAHDIEHLNRAIAAFRLLDRNNRVVERCTEYLEYLVRLVEQQLQPQTFLDTGGIAQGQMSFSADNGLPDLHDFLNGDLELAQFFASGIFDVQSSYDGQLGGFQ